MGRASKDKRDIYYRKAKEEGYRARSAYKLLQIHEEFNILSTEEITTGAVDLCAAPGSWSQVLASHFKRIESERKQKQQHQQQDGNEEIKKESEALPAVKPRIVAVDLQEMAPIDGVSILQGDITSEATANTIIELLNAPEEDEDEGDASATTHRGTDQPPQNEEVNRKKQRTEQGTGSIAQPSVPKRKADIVVCDGAPDVTGMHELDEYLQHQLLLAALTITTCVLRPGGAFVTKMFRGPNTPFLVAKSELFFDQVRVVKPKSSRNASMESFLVCQGFRVPPGYVPRFLNANSHNNNNSSNSSTVGNRDANQNHGDAEGSDVKGGREPAVEHASTIAGPSSTAGGAASASPSAKTASARTGDCFTPDAPEFGFATGTDGATHPEAAQLLQRHLLPFLSCGDLSGFDADMCYNREKGAAVLAPVQPPLEAPYLAKKAVME